MKKLMTVFVLAAFLGLGMKQLMPHNVLINLSRSIVNGVQSADDAAQAQIYGGVWDQDRTSDLRDSSG